MVAAYSPTTPSLPLICEPIAPPPTGEWGYIGRCPGWIRRDSRTFERRQSDDVWGATAQHIIVRYVLHGVERKQLAQDYSLSERQIQEYLSGQAWRAYTLPVLASFARLGLSLKRKNRQLRQERIAAAMLGRVADVVMLLKDDERPLAQHVVRELSFLAAGQDVATLAEVTS